VLVLVVGSVFVGVDGFLAYMCVVCFYFFGVGCVGLGVFGVCDVC